MTGAIFGAVSGLPLLVTFLGTRERPKYQQQENVSVKISLRAALRNRPFLFAVGIFLFTWTAIEIMQSSGWKPGRLRRG